MNIDGIDQLQSKLSEMELAATMDNQTVLVGYTQSYALKVHEDLEAHHKPGKKAKYLEAPARRLARVLTKIVVDVYLRTKSLSQGILAAGLRLQRESQEIVPVDTSALKASAFTAFESGANAAAAKAYQRSQAIRRSSR